MGTEWKRLAMQNGAWVATVTALAIGAGALLWYERPEPRYPTTRDEAEARFALLERWVAARGDDFGWGNLETVTNVVGFYPSRWFWTKPRYEAEWSVPALTWAMRGTSYNFIDLWGLGGVGGLQRPVAEYEFIVADSEKIGDDWWTTNIYAAAAYFGDYQYLHTNTLYMTTNILEQTGRALSAMRWTLKQSNTYGPELPTNSAVCWRGDWCIRESLADAFQSALDSWESALPEDGDGGTLPDGVMASMTNSPMYYQFARVTWDDTSTGTWAVVVAEYASFRQREYWVPAATNVAAWHIGAFTSDGAGWPAFDVFWHPSGVTGTWEIASAPIENLGGATNGFREVLFDWQGRIPRAEIEAQIPPDDGIWSDDRDMGWGRRGSAAYFVGDWQFQCLTDHAQFW